MVDPMEFEVRDVDGYEGLYQITADARIISLRTGKELKQRITDSGYPTVNLHAQGKEETIRVHRIYAKAFVPNPLSYPIVMHLDNDKLHINKRNLLWGTTAENNIAAYNDGLRPVPIRNCKKHFIITRDGVPIRECSGTKELAEAIKCKVARKYILRNSEVPNGPYKGCKIIEVV